MDNKIIFKTVACDGAVLNIHNNCNNNNKGTIDRIYKLYKNVGNFHSLLPLFLLNSAISLQMRMKLKLLRSLFRS